MELKSTDVCIRKIRDDLKKSFIQRIQIMDSTTYVVSTMDTKGVELAFVANALKIESVL